MKDGKILSAIIGCGGISRMHIAALQKIEDVRIAAVCDIRFERAEAAAEETGAKAYDRWQDVVALQEIDVVHICLPHYLHMPVAVEALKHGKNVLTEKPMATSVSDARKMIAASEEGAGMLGVIFQNRYNAAVCAARSMAQSGELGEFLGASAEVCWRRERPYYHESGWRGAKLTEGAGTLINQSIHTLDLLSYLGGPIEKVRGSVMTAMLESDIEVEDNAMAVAVYEGGQRAIVHTTNNYVTNAPVRIELAYEKATLLLYGDRLYRIENGAFEMIARGDERATGGKDYWGGGHDGQIADYYDSVRRGEKYWLDGREGLPALALVCGIVQSSQEKRWIQLEKAEDNE